MSETPVVPIVDQTNSQLHYGAERQQTYRYPERKMTQVEIRSPIESGRLELDADDVINPDVWTDSSAATFDIPNYAEAPKTYEQEVEESLHPLTEKQQVTYAKALTGAVSGLRKQYALGA